MPVPFPRLSAASSSCLTAPYPQMPEKEHATVICRRCLVSGRVQGVFFRASTARKATGLGVTGHAINLPDGRVEVMACGPTEEVEALCEWLQSGPPAARVDTLSVEEVECQDGAPATFTTG